MYSCCMFVCFYILRASSKWKQKYVSVHSVVTAASGVNNTVPFQVRPSDSDGLLHISPENKGWTANHTQRCFPWVKSRNLFACDGPIGS